MEPLVGVGIGIDTGVIGGELFHLIEAVLNRVGLGLVAKVPLTRKVRRIAVFLEELGNGRSFFSEKVLVSWSHHDRQRRADGNSSRDERGTSSRAACLAIPACKRGALFCHAVNIRGGMSIGSTAS